LISFFDLIFAKLEGEKMPSEKPTCSTTDGLACRSSKEIEFCSGESSSNLGIIV
jgi:hypothetical protein